MRMKEITVLIREIAMIYLKYFRNEVNAEDYPREDKGEEENIIEFKSFKERRLRIYAFNDECPDDTNDHCYSACLNEF